MPAIDFNLLGNIQWNEIYEFSALERAANVWKIPVEISHHQTTFFETVLSEAEKQRAQRFRRPGDKRRSIIARAATKLLIAKYLGIEAEKVHFGEGPGKKPIFLRGFGPDLYFNISHSGQWILIALSAYEIGVDLEAIDYNFSFQEILGQNFSLDEIEFINHSVNKVRAFFLLWTRKEALSKATAQGIHEKLSAIQALDGVRFVNDEIINSSNSWRVTSFNVDQLYIGSVACNPILEPVIFYHAPPSFFLESI